MDSIDQTEIQLPDHFMEWAKGFFKNEFPDFVEAMNAPPSLTVRCNPHKLHSPPFPGDPVPWNKSAWYLNERPNFALDPRWHGGAYYVQDASSMLIGHCLQQLSLPESPLLLDMCAAPGGKATLLIDAMPEDAVIVANEVIKSRFPILLENLERWGENRVFAIQADPSRLAALGPLFDVILVDAPCSGEGLFRKDNAAREQWSTDHVIHCALRQNRILEDADQCLNAGGYMIYSTCTFNEKENFNPILELVTNKGYELVDIELDPSWGVSTITSGRVTGYACYPHKVKGEGFFFSVLKKPEGDARNVKSKNSPITRKHPWPADWLPSDEQAIWQHKHGWCCIAQKAVPAFEKMGAVRERAVPVGRLGVLKGNTPVPDHTLALMRHTQHLPGLELDLDTALDFLRKKDQQYAVPKGWHIMRYMGLGLGWIKQLDKRSNNYFPTSYRLRS